MTPTGQERFFGEEEVIVSKTDPKGIITYANEVFCRVALYQESELLGKPHNIVRHPDMPRGVFKLLWDRLMGGHEVFAVVLNMARDGSHYWVLAHVTPSYAPDGRLTGYHSNRRCPSRSLVETVKPLYDDLLKLESAHDNPKRAAEASFKHLGGILAQQGMDYDEFLFSVLNPILDRELARA